MVELGVNSKAKTMKLGDDRQLDEAVYLWFAQKRMEGVPVSGLVLRDKALELTKKNFTGILLSLPVMGGSGVFAAGMELGSSLSKVRNYQVTKNKQLNS